MYTRGFTPDMQDSFSIQKINQCNPPYQEAQEEKSYENIVAEKVFDKLQHSFMVKLLSKVRIEGNFLNLVKNTKNLMISL